MVGLAVVEFETVVEAGIAPAVAIATVVETAIATVGIGPAEFDLLVDVVQLFGVSVGKLVPDFVWVVFGLVQHHHHHHHLSDQVPHFELGQLVERAELVAPFDQVEKVPVELL